jgi:hypothetical protein
MPEFRKLSSDEVAKIQRRRGRAVDLTEYSEIVAALGVGEMGEATVSADEKKATVKRRLTTAARRAGKELRYRRTGEDRLLFEVAAE